MKKTCIALVLATLAGPVMAQQAVTVMLTEQEAQAAMVLWEAGLKSVGGQAAKAYVVLSEKMQAAVEAAKKAPPAAKPDGQ